MDMRTSSNSGSSSPAPETQRTVRFSSQAKPSIVDLVDDMTSGFDMGSFVLPDPFDSRGRRVSPVNSVISYPEAPFSKPAKSAPSSIKSRDIRNGKHGVMAKCELLEPKKKSHGTELTSTQTCTNRWLLENGWNRPRTRTPIPSHR